MKTEEIRRVVGDETKGPLPEIYCFCNGGSDDWWRVAALSQDGEFLAGHVCSHPNWGPHDLGVAGSDWKHEQYRTRYPDGFVLVWCDVRDERVGRAHAKHLAAGAEGTPWQRDVKAAVEGICALGAS